MAQIDDVPAAVTPAGQSHDYPNPPGLSELILVSAPIQPGYIGHTRTAYNDYIGNEVIAGRAYQGLVTVLDPEYSVQVPLSYADASRYNYGRITIGGHPWYVRYTAEYAGPVTTRMRASLDPFASFDWQLGYCTIEQSHAAVAASQSDTYGDLYCLAPEPVAAPPVQGVLSAPVLSSDPADWTVVVVSPNDLRGHPTDFPYFEQHVENDEVVQAADRALQAGEDYAGGANGFTIDMFEVDYPWEITVGSARTVYVPSVRPSPPSTIDGVPAGGGVYLFTMHGFAEWASVLAGAPWVVEGISVRMAPNWAVFGGGDGTISVSTPVTSPASPAWDQASAIPIYTEALATSGTTLTTLAGWRDSVLTANGAGIYRKLVTAAFSRVLIGNGQATAEYLPDEMRTSGVNLSAVTGAAHGENSIRLTADYNELGDQQGMTMETGGRAGYYTSGYGRAAANTASADLGTVNAAYSNAVQREVVRRQQSLALEIGITEGQMNLGLIGVQTVMNAGVGAGMGAMGGPAGAVAGAVVGGGSALVTAGISNNNSLDILNISQDGSQNIAGYQLGASGVFSALSFRAWVQGLRAVSGSSVSAGLASAWRAVTGQAFSVIITAPAPDRVRALLSYWKRYGYMIGRAFKPSRLDVMSHYSYWKVAGDAQIFGPIPARFRDEIAAQFNAGVTIYNDIAEIGTDQSAGNAPVSGFTY